VVLLLPSVHVHAPLVVLMLTDVFEVACWRLRQGCGAFDDIEFRSHRQLPT